jgi:hypothetical protein
METNLYQILIQIIKHDTMHVEKVQGRHFPRKKSPGVNAPQRPQELGSTMPLIDCSSAAICRYVLLIDWSSAAIPRYQLPLSVANCR